MEPRLGAILFVVIFAVVVDIIQGRLFNLQREEANDGITVIDRRRGGQGRAKRSLELPPWTKIEVGNKVDLDLGEFVLANDSNNIAFVFWKQHKTDMIFILTCNSARTTSIGRLKNKGCESYSNFYMSPNLGEHFVRQDKVGDFVGYWLHSIYLSASNSKHVIATDYQNKTIFLSLDEAKTFERIKVNFAPTFIEFHPTVDKLVAAFDFDAQTLWWSEDYGKTWNQASDKVKKYFWQNDKLAMDAYGFYFERIDTENGRRVNGGFESSLIHFPLPSKTRGARLMFRKATGLVQNSIYVGDEFVLMQKAVDQQLYVVRPKSERHEEQVTYHYKNSKNHVHHGVISTENNEILLSVFHPDSTVTVYLSDTTGRKMYFVTENVIGGMLRNKTMLPKVDFYRVKGFTGTFIVNKKDNGTLISYDKGVTWEYLQHNSNDIKGNDLDAACKNNGNTKCVLNLYLSVEQLYSSYTSPLLSKESAPGIIIAQGRVGGLKNTGIDIMNSDHYVWISSNGGRYWTQTLDSSHGYAILNHGNLIAATPLQFTVKQDIKFTTDHGKTWLDFGKTHRYGRIAAIITDSTAKTLAINVFGFLHQQPKGSDVADDQWVVWKFNFTRVFSRVCKPDDYYRYVHTKEPSCPTGEKVSFLRPNLNQVLCYSPNSHDNGLKREPCACTKHDFTCEDTYVYITNKGDTSYSCKPVNDHLTHHYCNQNGLYYKTKGYRKLQGNKCKGGMESQLTGTYEKCDAKSPIVRIEASRTTADLNELVTFEIAYSIRTSATTYTWNFDDGTVLTGNFESMKKIGHAFTKMGQFNVGLLAKNEFTTYKAAYVVVVMDKTYHNSFITYHTPIVAGVENTFELKRLDKQGEPQSDLPSHDISIKFLWSFKGIYDGDTKSHQVKYTFDEPGVYQVECQIISPMMNIQTVIRTVRVYKAAYAIDVSFTPYLSTLNTGTATWANDFLHKLKSFIALRYDIDDADARVITEIRGSAPFVARVIICDVKPFKGIPYKSAESFGKIIQDDIVNKRPLLIGFQHADIHAVLAEQIGYIHPVAKDTNKPMNQTGNQAQPKIWIYVVVMVIIIVFLASLVIYIRSRRNKNGGFGSFCRGVFVRKDKDDVMQKKLVFHADEDCVGLEGPDLPQYVSD